MFLALSLSKVLDHKVITALVSTQRVYNRHDNSSCEWEAKLENREDQIKQTILIWWTGSEFYFDFKHKSCFECFCGTFIAFGAI